MIIYEKNQKNYRYIMPQNNSIVFHRIHYLNKQIQIYNYMKKPSINKKSIDSSRKLFEAIELELIMKNLKISENLEIEPNDSNVNGYPKHNITHSCEFYIYFSVVIYRMILTFRRLK